MTAGISLFSREIRVEYDNGNIQTFPSLKRLIAELHRIELAKMRQFPLWSTVTTTVKITLLLKAPVSVAFENDQVIPVVSTVTINTGASTKKCFEWRIPCHIWKTIPGGIKVLEIINSPIVILVKVIDRRAEISFIYPITGTPDDVKIRKEIVACLQRAIEELTEPCPQPALG